MLSVPSLEHLTQLQTKLEQSPLKFKAIYEPDEPYNGQITAIGIQPVLKSVGRKYLSCLPLLKDSQIYGRLAKSYSAAAAEVGESRPSSPTIQGEVI